MLWLGTILLFVNTVESQGMLCLFLVLDISYYISGYVLSIMFVYELILLPFSPQEALAVFHSAVRTVSVWNKNKSIKLK